MNIRKSIIAGAAAVVAVLAITGTASAAGSSSPYINTWTAKETPIGNSAVGATHIYHFKGNTYGAQAFMTGLPKGNYNFMLNIPVDNNHDGVIDGRPAIVVCSFYSAGPQSGTSGCGTSFYPYPNSLINGNAQGTIVSVKPGVQYAAADGVFKLDRK